MFSWYVAHVFSEFIIIIIIIIISFMQGIFTYIPETNYIPREYSVAAILLLLLLLLYETGISCHRPILPRTSLEPVVIIIIIIIIIITGNSSSSSSSNIPLLLLT